MFLAGRSKRVNCQLEAFHSAPAQVHFTAPRDLALQSVPIREAVPYFCDCVFVYLCTCVLVYLCTCEFVYLCIGVEVSYLKAISACAALALASRM